MGTATVGTAGHRTPTRLYRIASCTKSVTAATLLALVADGRVALDTPVTDVVPAFAEVALPSPDSPVPTLRMLLTMSAGLPTDDPWADRQESISDDELDALLCGGLLFDSVPGTRFAYSNLGYALLGRAVSVVGGAPYPDLATDTVLRPLGLDRTVFRAEDVTGHLVTGFRPHEGSWEPLPTTGPGAFSAIGGLFSTVGDLARWAGHLASATAADPAPGPISPADRRLMQQAMRVVPPTVVPSATRPTAYGFGLFVEQDPRFGELVSHSGGYPGFSAHMRWSARYGIGVVAFENATQAKVSAGAERALDLVLERTVGTAGLDGGADRSAPGVAATARATEDARDRVMRLLADWSDDRADALCTPNVAMDEPYERRRRAIAAAVAEVGADLHASPVEELSLAPSHLRWWVPGTAGRLRVEIRLAPLAPGGCRRSSCAPNPRSRSSTGSAAPRLDRGGPTGAPPID